jgi:hypothetical protein
MMDLTQAVKRKYFYELYIPILNLYGWFYKFVSSAYFKYPMNVVFSNGYRHYRYSDPV